jgi:autotransporter-associated beta strand protein
MGGGGSIRLTNLLNSYTGTTSIRNGTLIINSEATLGGTGTVSIFSTNTTPLNTNTIGFGGGSLVLDGTTGGFTFSRAIDFEGRGPIGERGSAIQSLGNNTLSGVLTSSVSPLPLLPTATIRNSRINSVDGTLTLSGTLNAGGTSATTFTSLGGVNSAGVGNFALNGALAGTGSIEKSGAGTLFLNPSSTSGFSGTVRISASSIGQQSSVRVTQATVGGTSIFGANIGTTTAAAIDLNGGVLEFRNDGDLNLGALASGKNAYNRAGSTIFTGPAAGGSGINGTTTLGALQHVVSTTASAATTTFNSRNGFGVTFSSMTVDANTSTSTLTNTLTNNMAGNLTFTGNITLGEGNTASRPRVLAIGGAGNSVIQGSVIAGTDPGKTISKSGTGNLTIQGVGTSVAGTISITAGAITATDFRSLNNNTAAISLGNATTTGGNLIIGGTGVAPTLAGLITSKTITLNTTSGSNSIYANQAGTNPVVLNGAITKITAATTGALILGGTNQTDNIINVAIPVETTPSTGGVTKLGSGTWVLNAANTYLGATTIQNGTLKLRATAASSDAIGSATSNTVVFSNNGTTGSAGGTLEFRGFSGAATTETLGALTPTAGAATIRLLGNGAAANLTFTSLGATTAASSVNFDTTSAGGGLVTLTGQAATTATGLPGTANFQGHLYFNGADFATTTAGGVVQAPTYVAAGPVFSNASTALVASVHNKLTAGFTQVGATTTISSLVTNNQTLTLSGNLVVSTGGILQSGGTASILSDSATPRLINQTGTAATNVAIRVNLSTDTLNLGSATNPVNIGSFTTGGLTKNGAGTLAIFGTNAQTGTATINEGKVSLNGASARLSATSASLVVRQGATLELLTGVAAANAVVNALDGAGTISGLSGQTFTQNGGGTWNGVFSGGLNITKGGAAATWSGLNTYTGVTTIGGTGLVTMDTLANGGVNSGIGASSSDAANLVFTGSTAGIDYRGSIIDNALTLGSRSATTDRLFTLAAAATGANLTSTASNSNAIVWSNAGAIVNNTTANATLTFAGASTGDNTFNPQLVNSSVGGGVTLAVTKSGAGQWNLGNSNNTYTGATTIAEGTLGLNDNGALPANSPLVLGSGTTIGILQMSGSFARNLSTTPTAGTGTVTWGGTTSSGGFAAHSTGLTVTLNGGTGLTWGSGGFVGTGGIQSLILNSASSLADVTFTNAIDLGAVARTVNVNDNGNTGADYANLTGVLSGAGGSLIKAGAGVLRLTGANSYTGSTTLTGGTLVVSSLGNSTGGATSGAGAGGVAMNDANALILGSGGAQATSLIYVGVGEVSDRKIRLNATGTNHANAIYADGSGPLILTNVANDMLAGAKTLSLRGSNTTGNMISGQLTNNGTDALSVTIDGGATWILTNATNSYNGATTVGAGALGIGDNAALGIGTLVFNNGNTFAYGADRTVSNAVTHNNNTTAGFVGDYSLSFSSALNLAASANNVTTTNSIAAGKSLTFTNGVTANALSANRAWIIDGSGETVINGDFTTSTAFGVRFDVNGGGTLTLGTNGATSNFNQSILAADVDHGTLKFSANNAIPNTFTAAAVLTSAGTGVGVTTYTVGSTAGLLVGQTFSGTNVPAGSRIVSIDGPTTFTTNAAPTTAVASGANLTFSGSGGVTLSPELATADIARIDLNGTTQMITAFSATTDGAVVIDNTSATPASFTFGANNSTVSITNTGARTITDSGAGALSIVKTGNTALTLPTGMTLTYQGSTSSTGGGSFTINSALNGTSGLIATGSSTLALLGGLNAPGAITRIEVGGGSTLSLLDGAGSTISNLTNLNLGAGAGTATLNLNVGDSLAAGDFLSTDTLTLLTGGTLNLANTITFNLTDAGLNPSTTYTLLNLVDGGLTAFGTSNIIQGATPGGFSGFTWTVTNNLVQLTTGTLITGSSYWRGLTNNTWNANPNNWSTDKAGSIPAASIPGSGTDVVFAYDGLAATPLTTTLEQNIKINSLTFEAGATTPTSVTIAPGAVTTNRLEVAPQAATDGIKITAGGPAAVTISAPLRLGGTVASQTWNVADAASVLTLSGGLQGEKDVTKTGSGKVTVSIAAENAFNSGNTADFTVNGGNLEILSIDALGVTGKRANVAVNTGAAFYYNNATAGTVTNGITLGGGTLSGGGGNHIYSGTVNVSGNSFINMADSNGPNTNAARNITLSGAVSGSGNLTIDGNNTLTSGNQTGGLLTLNNAANTWDGDLFFNRGTVLLTSAVTPSFTANDVIFNSFGRLQLQGVNGQTLTRSGTLAYGAGAIGEFSVDNVSATLTSDFLVDQNGAITLGSSGTGASVRVFLADDSSKVNFSGGVTLGGNSSISVGNAATRLLTISSVISDGGNNYSLAINDDAGGWGTTNGSVRLDAANTYTGGTVLASGTLILGHKDALSTGPLAVTAASTLNSLVDLTGLNARSNAVNLSAILTFTGANSITFSGTTTNIGAGGITNSLTSGNLQFTQVNLAEPSSAAARTLTIAGASTGSTTITNLVNNDQNNILTNNLTSTLSLDSIALSESAVIGRTVTLGGTGNTVVPGLIVDVAGSSGTAGTLAKAGTGVLTLQGANTFTGPVTIAAGVLEFSTVTNASGGASNLGNGATISLSGGNLRFVGSTSQSTNRPITTTASSTLSAHGTGGASITYTGAITQALDNSLTLLGADATTTGFITGGITQVGVAADLAVSSGNWTLSGTPSVLADDIIVTNASSVFNLTGASLISFTAGTSNGLYSRAGATINLLSNDIFGPANSGGLDFILLGDNTVGTSILNTNTFTIETPRLDLGQRNIGYEAQIDGIGTVLVTGGAIDLFRGTVNANLSTTGTTAFEKFSTGTVTLKGNNSGLGSTGATIVYEGSLVLDYTASNTTKLNAAAQLDLRGSSLILTGNASAASAQTVASFTLGNGGNSTITLNPGGGQDLILNLNAITRAVNAQDGTIRLNLPTGTQSATNGITTDTLNTIGTGTNAILGGWATVNDGTGVFFARNVPNAADGNIGAAVTSSTDAVASWLTGENISDSSGFTGTLSSSYVNSLRFNAASGSDVSLSSAGVLGINSGGILVTSNVGATPSLMNGTIFSGAQASNVPELIIIQDSSSVFEIGADLRTNSAFTKSGVGTVRLSGNNTYAGVTEIQDGTLQLFGGSAIGDNSLITFATYRPTTLQLLASETIGRLAGGQRQTDSDNGMVDVGSHTLTINQSAGSTYSGRFTGSGAIILNTGSTGNFNYNGQTSTGLFTGSVTVNGGLFQISGDTARLGSATAFTINGVGNFLLDNDAANNTTDRISDTATFTLNSAAGPFSGQTIVRGLANRNNDNDDAVETIGATTFNSGASYLSLEASGGTSAQARIVSTGWTRNNAATLNVRGTNLGGTANERTQFKVADANDAAMLAANIGGGGIIGGTAKNVSIIPWAIGEATTAGLADGNMGNTFLSYVDNRGFVPLSLTNEFSTFVAATAGDNVRESLGADLTGIAGATVNSLILNNTAFAGLDVTGTGAGQTLAITSGALMFTVTGGAASTAYDTTLGGFNSGITVGSTNEYVIHVVNPSSAATTSILTATIASPLTSSADITKAGRGTVILNQVNTAGGGVRRTTLNEGTLEIADLDNIGGGTGGLVFAGGTLRLGAGLTDDISSRTISFQLGGGTLDTNGIDLALANTLGSGSGAFTKVGAGNLTLNATSIRSGASTLSTGTITIGATNALGVGGDLSIAAGTTLALGANNISHGHVTTSGASPAITGTGAITASTGFSLNHTGDTTIDAILAGAGGLLKLQTNVVTLSGANSYTGTTEVQAGGLAFSSISNVGGGASSLGNPANAEAAIIRMGLTTAATGLTYTGSGHSTNRLIGMQGTTGGVTLNGSGTGAISYTSGVRFENAGNKTLTLRGTSDPAILNQIGVLTEAGGVLTLNKSDANTWLINGGSTYTGATQIDQGTLMIGVNNALPTTTTVRIGTGATAGTFDLNGFDQSIGSLLVQTNSNAVTNNIVVDSGKTLTVNGAVTIGVNADNSDTNLNATGGGAIVVNSGGANFQIGGATGATNENRVDVDFSGLTNFTANLGTGIFRLGDVSSSSGTSALSTFKLATNNTITAASIRIGDGSGPSDTHLLTLGSGTNVFNADTLNIGSAGATIRSGGSIVFDGADTTGQFTLRASDGTSRAVLNMINTTGNTAGNMDAVLNLAGHTSDILASTVTLATRSLGTGAASATFSFDQGTLDITTLNMASRTSTGTGGATAIVNLGDSIASGIPLATIGSINMAANTSSGGTVEADINITGGTVNIGTGSGTAVNMANASAGRTVTSDITLTGGTVEVTGNIVRTGGAGIENATITLNGASLDLNGNSIGAAGQTIVLAAQSGTLSGLGQLNGNGLLTKSAPGVLNLGNGNTYSGGTMVSTGTLIAANTVGSATGLGAVTVNSGATLGGTGIIAPSAGNAVLVDGTLRIGGAIPTIAQTLTIATNAAALTINDLLTFDLFAGEGTGAINGISSADRLLLTGNSGGATVALGASSIFEITTTITSGWVVGSSWQLINWAGLTPTGTFTNIPSTAGIGNFANLPDLSLFGLGWDVSAIYSSGTVSIGAIPEPSRAMLLMIGLLGLFWRRRRN